MATAQTRKRERRAAAISSSENDGIDCERRPEEIKRQRTQLSKPTVTARKLKDNVATSTSTASSQQARRQLRNAGAVPPSSQIGGLELTAPGNSLSNSPSKALKLTDPSSTRRFPQPEIRASSASSRNTPSPRIKQGYRNRKKSESPSKSLHSYFQRSTREQSWASSQNTTVTIDEVDEIQDDDIEDFLSDDEELEKLLDKEVKEIETRASSNLGGHRHNRANATLDWPKTSHAAVHKPPTSKPATSRQPTIAPATRSARFILPDDTSVRSTSSTQVPSTTQQQQNDHSIMRPWAEQYAPANLEELVVHKKKVSDVQRWLNDVFTGRSLQKVLVLRGPAGSGKTTTVSILAKVLGYEIIEWKQPLISEYSSSMNSTSLSAQFDEFLGRGEKFGALALTGDDEESTIAQKRRPDNGKNRRRVILVEEFPTFLGQASIGLSAFRASLQRYLAATVPTGYSWSGHISDSPPIVMVVSETMLGSANGAFDSFSAYRLLGPEISNHPGIGFIDFNPVAVTFMAKAIDLAIRKYARQTNRRPNVSPAMLKPFYGSGDIRSAISAVEFLCLRDPAQDYLDKRHTASKPRRPSVTGTEATENEPLQTITQREASLGLFHATAKVVHNKRDPPSHVRDRPGLTPTPPAHMQQHSRSLVSQVEVDNLMNETGTDVSTFLASLHENFPLSCSGSSFAAKYDGCMEYLSNADLLESDSHRNLRSGRLGLGSARSSLQGYNGGIDMLRQDEMSFHVGVRGLLFSLPYPVKRTLNGRPSRGRADVHKMYYPTSAQLWRRTEELDGMVDQWVHRLTTPTKTTGTKQSTSQSNVSSWKARAQNASQTEQQVDSCSRVLLSRDEVLLERLPYLRHITQNPMERRNLEQVTQFYGVGSRWTQLPEEPEPEPDPTDSSYAIDQTDDRKLLANAKKPVTSFHRPRKDSFGSGSLGPARDAIEKLILSDDDIEDD